MIKIHAAEAHRAEHRLAVSERAEEGTEGLTIRGGKAMKTLGDRGSEGFSRRSFLAGTSALSAASFLGLARSAAAESPPETPKVRLIHAPSMCLAPQYIAGDLLRAEGFAEVEYVPFEAPAGTYTQLWLPGIIAEGLADFSMGGVVWYPPAIDSGAPLLILAGIHVGCYELFANSGVQSIRDLKGKTVAGTQYGDDRLFISAILSYVGMDPRKDINWVTTPTSTDAMQLFVEGKVDAFIGFPPEPQELRAKKIGRVILNTATDRPWSQYFCCLLAGNREFVRKYPVATKKVCARLPQSCGHLCERSQPRCPVHGGQGLRQRLQVCPGAHHRVALQPVARRQSGRHAAFSCAAPARSGHDQDHARRRSSPRAATGGFSTS